MADPIVSAVARLQSVPNRLKTVASAYLLSLLLDSPKHTQTFAARVSGLSQSQFSRLLSGHRDVAIASLDELSKEAAKIARRSLTPIVTGAPWTVGILIDATLHPRSSLHVQNSQRLHHGEGFVVGHQWTNIVLLIGDQTIPLPPIPFLSRSECKRRGIKYKTANEALEEYLADLNLASWIGCYLPSEIVVLSDSGYDGKRFQRAVLARGWDILTAIKRNRSAQTNTETGMSPGRYRGISELFRSVRKQAPWETVRVEVDGGKRRKEFRARRIIGRLRGIRSEMALICSEKSCKKGRMYFACSNTTISTGTIIRAYRRRWAIEMFHRAAKQQLGMLDAGVEEFDSLIAHVHWVYCAYILLDRLDLPDGTNSLSRQRHLSREVESAPWRDLVRRILDEQTRFGARERTRTLCREALGMAIAS